jgi:hypothetical protein
MKLYIRNCAYCRSKIYINATAYSRNGLRRQFGDSLLIRCGVCGRQAYYPVLSVCAEANQSAGAGAVIGGLVGLLGGPVGALIGLGLGAAVGGANDTEERQKVINFNRSW